MVAKCKESLPDYFGKDTVLDQSRFVAQGGFPKYKLGQKVKSTVTGPSLQRTFEVRCILWWEEMKCWTYRGEVRKGTLPVFISERDLRKV